MSDYWVSVRVRNARIRRKIAECGFRSVNDLCRKAGLRNEDISGLLNLKDAPLTQSGSWRRPAIDLAEALGCTCEELFSESQRTLTLPHNEGESLITEAELLRLASRAEQPLLENPEEQLIEEADEYAKCAVVRRALDALRLSARDRRIVESYFGIGCEEHTATELAAQLAVSRQFIVHCLNRTLERLRGHPKTMARRSLLQAYRPANALGRAEEARLRFVQQLSLSMRAAPGLSVPGRRAQTQLPDSFPAHTKITSLCS